MAPGRRGTERGLCTLTGLYPRAGVVAVGTAEGWEGAHWPPQVRLQPHLPLYGLFSMRKEPSLKMRVRSLPCSALKTPTSPQRRPISSGGSQGLTVGPALYLCASLSSLLLNPRVGPHCCLPPVQTTRPGPTAGPLYGLCPLPGIFFPQIPARLAPLSPRSFLQISRPRSHLDTEGFSRVGGRYKASHATWVTSAFPGAGPMTGLVC